MNARLGMFPFGPPSCTSSIQGVSIWSELFRNRVRFDALNSTTLSRPEMLCSLSRSVHHAGSLVNSPRDSAPHQRCHLAEHDDDDGSGNHDCCD